MQSVYLFGGIAHESRNGAKQVERDQAKTANDKCFYAIFFSVLVYQSLYLQHSCCSLICIQHRFRVENERNCSQNVVCHIDFKVRFNINRVCLPLYVWWTRIEYFLKGFSWVCLLNEKFSHRKLDWLLCVRVQETLQVLLLLLLLLNKLYLRARSHMWRPFPKTALTHTKIIPARKIYQSNW